MRAVALAAFAPPLFSDLRDQFEGTPPSDNNLKAYLLRRGFNQKSVAAVIRAYRDTIGYVEHEQRASSSEVEIDHLDEDVLQPPFDRTGLPSSQGSERTPVREEPRRARDTRGEDEQKFLFKIAMDCTARVLLRGQATQEAITMLIDLLNLQKHIFPTSEPRSTQPIPQSDDG